MQFEELNISEHLLKTVQKQGYETPTPIQEQAIPLVISGRDVLGCAQTGTGKTAAFALPILQRLAAHRNINGRRAIRVLVLAPTRELASQINDSFGVYGAGMGLRRAVIYGGVNQRPQTISLDKGVDIVTATPGRLLDLMNQGYVNLSSVEILVLDEADRMLDMGFIHDIRRIAAALPKKRQSLLFSATLPPEIQNLAKGLLDNPVTVSVTPSGRTVDTTRQAVYFVERNNKVGLLVHLLAQKDITRALVFTRTKHGADKVAHVLERASVAAEAIHGNKSQNCRTHALESFKNGTTRVLVATDVASRGLDISDLSHVINYDLPNEPQSYVHRIGRTGRAGAVGTALSFCDVEERAFLRDIERLIQMRLDVETEHPFHSSIPAINVAKTPMRSSGGRSSSFHGGHRTQTSYRGYSGATARRH